jgi:PadR family transcriptional regulator PadR
VQRGIGVRGGKGDAFRFWRTTKSVHLSVLRMLSVRDAHGYEMMMEFGRESAGFFTVSPSTLYPALRQLEERGHIRSYWLSDGARKRRVYTITAKGLRTLSEIERISGEAENAMHAALESTLKALGLSEEEFGRVNTGWLGYLRKASETDRPGEKAKMLRLSLRALRRTIDSLLEKEGELRAHIARLEDSESLGR